MKKLLLSAVSASAILISANAYAESASAERTINQSDSPVVTKESIKKGWDKTKGTVTEAAESVSETTKGAYEATKKKTREVYNDIISAIKDGKEVTSSVPVHISQDAKVSGVIGQPLKNTSGERIGLIKDLIIDQDGEIKMLILGDGDYLGLGKTVAFDYSVIATRNIDGDIIAPLTEESVQSAAAFSYNTADAGKDMKVVPTNGYSVNKILDGDIINTKNQKMADLDDAVISSGKISHFIISYGQTLRMGGEKVVIAFNDTTPVTNNNKVDFQLSIKKSAQFEIYKNSLKN